MGITDPGRYPLRNPHSQAVDIHSLSTLHMKHIGNIQHQKKPDSQARSGRDAVIDEMLAKLNPSRVSAGYKPYTADLLIGKIAAAGFGTSEQDLYTLHNECLDKKVYGAYFHWKLGSKKQ
jgi:hypothetical protein